MGCGRRGSNRKTGNKRTPPNSAHSTHLPCTQEKFLPQPLFRHFTMSHCMSKKKTTWPSSSVFSTSCLLFHTALLSVRFKNTATIWMPYLSFPTYHKFFPLLFLKSVYCRAHFYKQYSYTVISDKVSQQYFQKNFSF